MAALGSYFLVCPVCHLDLHIPLHLTGPVTQPDGTLGAQVTLDRLYVERHWRTHKSREDLPVAA